MADIEETAENVEPQGEPEIKGGLEDSAPQSQNEDEATDHGQKPLAIPILC